MLMQQTIGNPIRPMPITDKTIEKLEMLICDYEGIDPKLWDVLSDEEIKYFANYLSEIDVEDHFISDDDNDLWFHSPFSKFPVDLYKRCTPEILKECGEGAEVKCRMFKTMIQSPDISDLKVALTYPERPYRPRYLLELIKKHPEWSDEQVWDLITDIWIDTEMPYQQRDLWSELFSLRTPTESLVSDLPDEFTIYRGGDEDGYSWTLSEEKAEWFEERNQRFGFKNTQVLKRTVRRKDVLFYNNDREEQEVVILPMTPENSGRAK